jgi:ribonuclease HI
MSQPPAKTVSIYTDGACSGNPGPGGFGVVMIYRSARKELSGGYRWTTNNRMELLALVKALEALREPCILEIFSDSKYLLGGF